MTKTGWEGTQFRRLKLKQRLPGLEAAIRKDRFFQLPGTLGQVTTDHPVILLAHEPDIFVRVPPRVCLPLAGHTHGGQFWPWNLFVRYFQPFTSGLHRLRNLWVYVSRGTGYWGPPKRFGAPSEITHLTLVRSSS